MRRTVTLAAALVTALLLVVAPPASAGGPTSVLVVNYSGNRAAGALTGGAAYAALAEALDVYNQPTGASSPPASFMEASVRLTWMIHDVTPWRIDALVVDGDDVWVETVMDTDAGKSLFETRAIRHRAADAALLLSTLRELGVYGAPATAADGASRRAAVDAADAATPAGQPATTAQGTTSPSAPSSLPGAVPWWASAAAAALTLGLGLVLGRRHASPSRHGTDPEPQKADLLSPREVPVDFTPDPDARPTHPAGR